MSHSEFFEYKIISAECEPCDLEFDDLELTACTTFDQVLAVFDQAHRQYPKYFPAVKIIYRSKNVLIIDRPDEDQSPEFLIIVPR